MRWLWSCLRPHRRRFALIDGAEYREAAKRMHAQRMTASNVAKVARSLDATAVVHGRVSGKGSRQVVTLYVRDGKSGKVIEKHQLRVKNGVMIGAYQRLGIRNDELSVEH